MALRNPIKNLFLPLLLLLLLIAFSSVVFGATDPGDYEVLDEFRKGLSNADLLGWPTDNQDPCGSPRWPYIFCSGTRVAQIQTKSLGLVGTLPSNFNKLTMLENIGLQANNLTGALPSFKGLSNLQYAYLGNNKFDTIPSDFFVGLDNLQALSLENTPLNQSTGWMLPEDLANSAQLTNLSIVNCNLAGPLPDFLGSMRSLANLKLSYNRLTGPIPVNYSGLPLQTLWLNDQQGQGLSGTLDVITTMTSLTDVWLNQNQFTGRIPASISDLASLSRLWLNGNKLVGMVPANLTNLPQLQSLHLDNNAFMGPIPKVSFSDFTYSSNSFCQSAPGVPCPPEVAALLDFLEEVNYPPKLTASWSGNNSCSGSWLGISCSNGKTTVINLPNYHLNGTISPSIGNLDALTQILLGGNNLNGTIPSSLTNLTSLRKLDISSNNISPPVPKFLSSVEVVLDGNRLLDGSGSSDSNAPSESSGSSSSGSSSSSSKSKTLIIVIVVVVVVIILILAIAFLVYRKKWKKTNPSQPSTVTIHPGDPSDPDKVVQIMVASKSNTAAATELQTMNSSIETDTHIIESGNLIISVQVLRAATRNFAPENELGRGGFGVVYKGELHDGTMIAVKRTESAVLRNTGLDEFQAEIAVLSKVRHRHLVSILGYSVEDNESLLVYEYMPQGALNRHLFQWKQFQLEPLSWKKRLNIALDVARGIEYLHNFANQSFIHRDLKSANILLTDDYRAKISDFGLAKLAPDGNDSVATKLAGTFGYLAPEYAVTGKVTTKVDVFSYGVVLMELVTGLKALDETRPDESRYLASYFIQMKSSKEKLRSIIDPSLVVTDETFDSICIIAELAGHCVARDSHQRPDMSHAVNVLAPLVEKWKPVGGEQDEYLGIDLCQPLLKMVMGWQAADGQTSADSSMNLDTSKGSIPARPVGFAESFTSMDGR
ncbi:receptor protein kinase TMK1-like [Canna indica]|uniref:Receptor protein kinase TMK1-like n=1 Tax=Canna indica TaxID=4628 RepID=A0AAQ3KAZ5_9LILI|nr:receptor protein kinase TMK1-like [Canna indica]